MRRRLVIGVIGVGLLALYALDRDLSNTVPAAGAGTAAVTSDANLEAPSFRPTAAAVTPKPTEHAAPGDKFFPFTINADQQDVIRNCLSKSQTPLAVHASPSLKLEDIVRNLTGETSDGSVDAKGETEVINIHVQKPNGDDVRLHAEPAVGPSKKSAYFIEGQHVRLFGVDQDGLPVALPFPADLRADSLKQVINRFITGGRVTFRERRSQLKTAALVVHRVETDGHLTELQLIFENHSLGCAWKNQSLSCDCL